MFSILIDKVKYAYCLLIIFLCFKVNGQNEMHVTEQLLNGSIKIEAINGNITSSGTGFFFTFYTDDKKNAVPVIITNKHVINGSKSIRLFFRKVINGKPDYAPPYVVSIPNDSTTVINHPNKNIDLVAIPTAQIYDALSKRNIGIYYIASSEEQIVDDATQKKELKSIEDIWMIGYPNGLWDSKNNLPIVRKGITATTPYIDYNGKREFLIDIAAFGGSSGSPIYFYRDFYTDKDTYAAKVGVKLYLLGVLYAGPIYTVEGKVVKSNPNEPISKVKTGIPMNLGYVIKASEILEFKKILIP
ncbi:serine protease [Yeosuana marina]|uniref:S1 family peptidase n=1 Tax=Yeosuana marina TaxID=1565536 RepID=UPI0030C849C3